MSMYNMLNGVNVCSFFIAPLLFGHPEDNIGRFRDCFLTDSDKPKYNNHIFIYTRLGGGNRKCYCNDIEKLQSHELYVEDYDDDFDCTYATFVFKRPPEFENDIKLIEEGKLKETSEKYKNIILKTFPTIEDKLKNSLY